MQCLEHRAVAQPEKMLAMLNSYLNLYMVVLIHTARYIKLKPTTIVLMIL